MRVSVLICVAAALLAAACGTNPSGSAGTTSPAAGPTAVAPSPSPPTATTPAPTAAPSPTGATIEVEVRGGTVVGGVRRVVVPLGGTVRLVVRADVADEVHVHGYDLTAEVTPDTTATLEWQADIPGVFEVELEHAGLPLLELEVR